MRALIILTPLLLIGCGDDEVTGIDTGPFIRPDTDDPTEEGCEGDFDCDGFPTEEDCDDTDPFTNPDAQDIPYDGIDNDCKDGDNNDIDGDGYVGTSAEGGDDCNDVVADINPGATEICYNDVDEDCDGVNLAEIDGDCDQDGYATNDPDLGYGGDDCMDDDADINPAQTEVWYDGVDQDCDAHDDFDSDFDDDKSAVYGGNDCDDTDPNINRFTNELWDGIDQNCNTIIDDNDPEDALLTLTGTTRSDEGYYGWSMDFIDDLDDDGYREFAVGSPLAMPPASGSTPAGWVLIGTLDAGEGAPSEQSLTQIVGANSGHMLGWDLAAVGDLDDDGEVDLVVGAPGNSNNAAYLFTSAQLDDGGSMTADAAAVTIAVNRSGFGANVAALGAIDGETIDGDAIPDVIIGAGAYTDDDFVTLQSDTWVGIWSGADFDPVDGNVTLDQNDTIATISDTGYGGEVIGGADFDNDGLPDVVVTSDVDGRARIVIFDSSEIQTGGDRTFSDFTSLRGPEGVRAAIQIGWINDLDGDGYDELAIAAPDQTTADEVTSAGIVYIIDQPTSVSGDITDHADITISGRTTGGGLSVNDRNPDFDNDGRGDVIVADVGDGPEGAIESEVFIFSGDDIKDGGAYDTRDRSVSFSSDETGDLKGYTAVGGDIDDDGDLDLLIGAPRTDISIGAAFLYESQIAAEE